MTSLIRDRAAYSAEMIEVFGDEALLAHACRFEAALARAEAAEGVIAPDAAALIAEICAAPELDVATMADAAAHAGTLAIPLVRHLRAGLAARDKAAAETLHLGATSQDVQDTALMLQAKAGVAIILRDLARLGDALAQLAAVHETTAMTGRTLLQPALPIAFGLKAANWMLGIDAARARLEREAADALALQFGGATGTRAGLDGKGAAIAARMAAALGLACPPMPWQARRDGIAGLGAALAIATGATAKIARDVSLMAQGEVAEAFEPKVEGRGGSSSMAHKRNPTGCQVALSASLRAPHLAATLIAALPQEQERGLGGWQAEAPVLAELFCLAHGGIAAMCPVVEGLEVHAEAMARNLEAAGIGTDIGESAELIRAALDQHGKQH